MSRDLEFKVGAGASVDEYSTLTLMILSCKEITATHFTHS